MILARKFFRLFARKSRFSGRFRWLPYPNRTNSHNPRPLLQLQVLEPPGWPRRVCSRFRAALRLAQVVVELPLADAYATVLFRGEAVDADFFRFDEGVHLGLGQPQ